MRSLKTAAAASIIAIFAAGATFAATPPAPLEIEEAVRLTLTRNASLRQLEQELVKAQAFRLQADGTLLPSVAATGTADKQREPQTTDGSDRDGTRSLTAELQQTIYSGGKNSAMRAQSPQVRKIAESALAEGRNAAVGELYARFYNVILKRKQIEAEEAAVATSQLHLKQVAKMAELGLATRLDVIRAAKQLASNTAALAEARGFYENANISLLNFMALAPEEARNVRGALYEPKSEGGVAGSIAAAQANRPDRKGLEEQLAYQINQIKIEKSGLMPKVSAGLSTGWADPYQREDKSGDTWRAELKLAVPIFDRNVTRSAVIKAKAVREQDAIALEQKEIDIKSEVTAAWNDIETSKKSLRASEKALELAKETLRLAQAGFREGVTPQLDLLDAQSQLTLAQLEYNRAQYNCIIAAAALKMTEGLIVNWSGDRGESK